MEKYVDPGSERDEFIRLLRLHPECYPILREILTPAEPEQEVPA